jgi:hypothetical protein
MDDRKKDRTLLEKTISRLVGFKGIETARAGASQPLPLPIRAPSPEHLDFGAGDVELSGEKAARRTPERTGPQQAAPHARHVRFAAERGRTRRTAILLLLLWAIAVLTAANEFYGRPLLDSHWLKLGTYRTIVGNLPHGRLSANPDATERLMGMKLTGIASSNDRSSAVIGGKLIHEGQIISGVTIVSIDTEGVTFRANGRTWMQKIE